MTHSANAVLHDGTIISVTISGSGPALFLPVRAEPRPEAEAALMRAWGADPDLGPNLVMGLSPSYQVVAADYEGPRLAHCDMQLAIRTDRLWALVMGGFPPLEGPYKSVLAVTRAAHAAVAGPAEQTQAADVPFEPGDWDAATIQTTEAQTRQFVRLCETLQDFEDSTAAVAPDLPRLAFAGSADQIDYGPRWGDEQVRIGAPLAEHERELTPPGWDVQERPGLGHLGAVQSSVVVPLLKTWLDRVPRP